MLQIFVLPLSFITAYIAAFFILFNPVKNKLKFVSAHLLKLKYKLSDINTLVSLILIEGLSLSYVIVDRFFMGRLPEGGIAALNYALVIYALPVTIFSIPIITTMFSKFSSSVKSPEILRADFKNASGINLFIIMPIAFLLFFYGDVFLSLFYERGKFTSGNTLLTYSALQFYSLSLVFYSTYLIVVKLLYSIDKYYIVLAISAAAFFLKVIFNFLLVDNLKQNGLALSTSLIYIFLFLAGFYLVTKKINLKEKHFYFAELFYFAVNGTISYLVALMILNSIDTNSFVSEILQPAIFLTVYILNSFLMNDSMLKAVTKTVFNLIGYRKM
jgi:putative peptidoglycan lipid II flippase